MALLGVIARGGRPLPLRKGATPPHPLHVVPPKVEHKSAPVDESTTVSEVQTGTGVWSDSRGDLEPRETSNKSKWRQPFAIDEDKNLDAVHDVRMTDVTSTLALPSMHSD